MLAHNNSGTAYQDRILRAETVVNHNRGPNQQPRSDDQDLAHRLCRTAATSMCNSNSNSSLPEDIHASAATAVARVCDEPVQ
jgi:hypothetical protein